MHKPHIPISVTRITFYPGFEKHSFAIWRAQKEDGILQHGYVLTQMLTAANYVCRHVLCQGMYLQLSYLPYIYISYQLSVMCHHGIFRYSVCHLVQVQVQWEMMALLLGNLLCFNCARVWVANQNFVQWLVVSKTSSLALSCAAQILAQKWAENRQCMPSLGHICNAALAFGCSH